MLVPPVPGPSHDLPGVALVFFFGGVALQPDVVADIEMEKGPAFPACFSRNQLVEADVLWEDAVLLDVEEV